MGADGSNRVFAGRGGTGDLRGAWHGAHGRSGVLIESIQCFACACLPAAVPDAYGVAATLTVTTADDTMFSHVKSRHRRLTWPAARCLPLMSHTASQGLWHIPRARPSAPPKPPVVHNPAVSVVLVSAWRSALHSAMAGCQHLCSQRRCIRHRHCAQWPCRAQRARHAPHACQTHARLTHLLRCAAPALQRLLKA